MLSKTSTATKRIGAPSLCPDQHLWPPSRPCSISPQPRLCCSTMELLLQFSPLDLSSLNSYPCIISAAQRLLLSRATSAGIPTQQLYHIKPQTRNPKTPISPNYSASPPLEQAFLILSVNDPSLLASLSLSLSLSLSRFPTSKNLCPNSHLQNLKTSSDLFGLLVEVITLKSQIPSPKSQVPKSQTPH